MCFRFLPLLAIFMIAWLLVMSSKAHATGEDTGWSRTTTEGATASFTISHRPDLVTEGSVQVSKRLRWGRNIAGVEVIEAVKLQGQLLLCEGKNCRIVWTFKANKDVTAENLSHISSGSASAAATLPVTVRVRDFDDVDHDSDRSEVVISFTAIVSLAASWTWEIAPNLCGENGQAAGDAISEKTVQPASFSGNLAGQKLTTVSATASQSDTILGKKPSVGPCT